MCTVVVRIQPGAAWPVTMLALRDEDPRRPWDPPGAWWPERGSDVVGVHDRSAGGAWLAASDARRSLAVVLNRAEPVPPTDGGWATRGTLPLDAVTRVPAPVERATPGAPDRPPQPDADRPVQTEEPRPQPQSGAQRPTQPQPDPQRPTQRAYNLVEATPDGVVVTAWDGNAVHTERLGPGVHVVTEGAPDDVALPRIGRWLAPFRAAQAPTMPPPPIAAFLEVDPPAGALGGDWGSWFDVLRGGADVAPGQPDAILRDDAGPDGHFATLSVVAAAVGPAGAVVEHARLATPGRLGTRP